MRGNTTGRRTEKRNLVLLIAYTNEVNVILEAKITWAEWNAQRDGERGM